ncbi:MAG: hypothetical protein ACI3T9_03865 [Romboutsia timonensis]
MEKSRVIVLAKKKNAKEVTRGYLVYNIGNPTPFIVCSYYQEYENKVEWDWGHYFDNLEDALKFFYQDEIGTMKNNICTIIDGNFTRFINSLGEPKAFPIADEIVNFENNLISDFKGHYKNHFEDEFKSKKIE